MPYKLKGNCVVKSDTGAVVKCHKTRADALKHLKALKVNVPEATTAASAIAELQLGKPQLTTVSDVQVVKTGIEYPLSSGPTTFTPEDLAEAVGAQADPAVPKPRVWIGHYDDKRIHGERQFGPPSGEPAVGKIDNMRLTDDGNCVVGDLVGAPIWLANILSSAFPSRSIEGKFNVKTPTGKKWRLVITDLALLGVVWPGVTTLEDIAALYTKEGPDVTIVEATPDKPVSITAAAERKLSAQVTVEDLRRQWYDATKTEAGGSYWWLRAIYIEPNEVIVDDDEGNLYRQPFTIKDDEVTFGKMKKVKIKYVNASHGGVEAEPINQERAHVALFEPGGSITVNLLTPKYIDVNLTGGKT